MKQRQSKMVIIIVLQTVIRNYIKYMHSILNKLSVTKYVEIQFLPRMTTISHYNDVTLESRRLRSRATQMFFKCLFGTTTMKTSALRITGPFEGNPVAAHYHIVLPWLKLYGIQITWNKLSVFCVFYILCFIWIFLLPWLSLLSSAATKSS